MEGLLNIQEDVQSKLLKAKTNFKKSPKDRLTVSYIETRLDNLQLQWQLFDNTHIKIISACKKSERLTYDYFKEDVYDSVEDLYINFKSELKELLSKLKVVENSNIAGTSAEATRIKLPEVKIPVFSGKYSEWQTFRDLFISLIHKNQRLDDAQRLYYLKGHLVGEAQQLLNNVDTTADNYKSSWTKLESRYNNKRFLANGILKRLLNQKALVSESATEIKNIVNITSDCLDSIRNLGIDASTWDILIIHIISAKLDRDTRKAWELKVSSDTNDELPTFQQFSDFLIGRFRGLENLETRHYPQAKGIIDKRSSKSFHIVKAKNSVGCAYCTAEHKITACKKFGKESNETRRNFAMENNLCFVCLNSNHSAKYCKNIVRCQVCKRRHHSLLHPRGVSGSEGENTETVGDNASSLNKSLVKEEAASVSNKLAARAEGSNQRLVSCLSTGNCANTVLLTTALVQAESRDGTYRTIRALLDQGSQGSFITEAMVQYLGLKRITAKHTVTGVGGDVSLTSRSIVTIQMRSRINPEFRFNVNAYVLQSVTSLLPVTRVTRLEWVNLTAEDLADPEYHRPNKIDILLGAEVYSQIILSGIKRNPSGSSLAQNTALGWILSGTCEVENPLGIGSHISVMHASVKEVDMLKKFWEMESEPPGDKKILTEDEIRCEDLFTATTTRDSSGRYVVRLPFHDTDPDCKRGESKKIAEKRYKGLEHKLNKNLQFKTDYNKVLQEYLDLNHMEKVSENDNKESVYLPHHAVIREDKDTTKIRVVFDASCKGMNGKSLNDDLMIGPSLQAELRHTIMRWRTHKICLVGDIVKMYRQVLVNRQDTKYQRILWRQSPEKEVEEFELVTVTFGTASAPYLAVRALHQTAYDECSKDPEIANIILKDFYMDDLMTGASNVERCFNIYKSITDTLSKGGFQMQKWRSNSERLLGKIRHEGRSKDGELRIKIDELTKILGLTWNSHKDLFQYTVDLAPPKEPATKRNIISDISRLFDPLGWLAPCVIIAKIFIQKLWLAGIEWDQEVPSKLLKEWMTYRQNLPLLANVKIPRWLHTDGEIAKTELHGFADASKLAYAAVVYLRVVDKLGNVHVSLLTSKTKVAPIKQVSIPRLELCGAVLLAKLMVEVAKVLNINMDNLYAYTDSEVVLAWLNQHPSRWKTFVGNRVSEILTTLDTHHWYHVASKENSADCASRGVCPTELYRTSIWFNGPEFLRQTVINFRRPKHFSTTQEQVRVHTMIIDTSFWQRFSVLGKLLRVVAYCRRFLNLRKSSDIKNSSKHLSFREVEEARELCIKRCQEQGLSEELEELNSKRCLAKTRKKLKSLNLFLDDNGIIRVGGRLQLSQLPFNEKHPILIPKESFLTDLLVADAHQKTMHGGPQLMVAYLRSMYWIIGVKGLVKKYYRNCVTCVRYSAKATAQLMGQLPSSRVSPNKPFLISGVDYAGPVQIRVSKGRGNKSYKGYIALFVCMTTRAIHLEAVSDMTAQGFLAAFKRFVARRGRCAELHSDNGTNFVGAARELIRLFHEEKSTLRQELAEELAYNGTQWNFIPPRAPNFGGLWEAGIKSTKYHLRRVIGNSTLTYEELATVLAQIEACLNSRPLSYVEEQADFTVLTPGHFLVGEPLVLVPDYNYEKVSEGSLRRWQYHQKMMQDFWRRWSQDYLHQFLQRHKWEHRNPEPSLGDVVLIKEDDMPPGRWLLGKIQCKHPGPDNITRVVTVRTKDALIKRPTSKLCVLPVTV